MTACFLHYGSYPINNPINHTRRRAVNDDRSCDLEHIGADAEDEASACVNLGRSVFCRNSSNSFDFMRIIGIYIKAVI